MNAHNLFSSSVSSRLSLSNHPHESVRRPKPISEGGEAERRQDGPCPFAEAARESVVMIHKYVVGWHCSQRLRMHCLDFCCPCTEKFLVGNLDISILSAAEKLFPRALC